MTRQEAIQMVLNDIETWDPSELYEFVAEKTLRELRYLPDYELEAVIEKLLNKRIRIG